MKQSTVSKDLEKIRKKMKAELRESGFDHQWGFARYLTGMDAVTSRMWEIADDRSIALRERIEALSLLMRFYEERGAVMPASPNCFEQEAKKDGK